MNDDLFVKPPVQPDEPWETTVRELARDFAYPPTPDIVRLTSQRLVKPRRPVVGVLKWAAVALFAVMVVIISVPEARAFVAEIIRIGAIQIFIGQPMPTSTPTAKPVATQTSASGLQGTLYLASSLEMPNETTFEEALRLLKSPIQLPSYPAGIGKPDHVYVQQYHPGAFVTLVWLVPDTTDKIWLTLDILDTRTVGSKYIDNDVQYKSTWVNETRAEWLSGLHEVGFFGGNQSIIRAVNGNVLIWLVGQNPQLTYRLEGDISQEEAIRIAESMTDVGTP